MMKRLGNRPARARVLKDALMPEVDPLRMGRKSRGWPSAVYISRGRRLGCDKESDRSTSIDSESPLEVYFSKPASSVDLRSLPSLSVQLGGGERDLPTARLTMLGAQLWACIAM